VELSEGSERTIDMIHTLSGRLDHLEKEVAVRNAILNGEAPPPGSRMKKGRSKSSMSSSSTATPAAKTYPGHMPPRVKSQQGLTKFALTRPLRVNVGGGIMNATHMHNADTETVKRNLAQARKAFEAIDVDKSGAIDKDELKRALEKQNGKKMDPRELNLLFSHLDTNKDGQIDFKEFQSPKPMKPRWAAGVGWRYDGGLGGIYNPHAWAAGQTVDQKKAGSDTKIKDAQRTLGKQLANGTFKKPPMAGAAGEPFVPSDATVRSDLTALIKHAHGSAYEKWHSEKEDKQGSIYYPAGRLPECREHPENRGLSRQWVDGLHKIKYVPTASPMHSFSRFAGACIEQNIKFTESGGFYADGPILGGQGKSGKA